MDKKPGVTEAWNDLNDPLMSSGYCQGSSALTMGSGGSRKSYEGYKIDADGKIITGEQQETLTEKLKQKILSPLLQKLGL